MENFLIMMGVIFGVGLIFHLLTWDLNRRRKCVRCGAVPPNGRVWDGEDDDERPLCPKCDEEYRP